MFELREWLKEKKHKTSPWGKMLDSNGYSESLWDTENGVCMLCGIHGDTARHEIFFGTADRKTSKATGCWMYLCPTCHNRVHSREELDIALKRSTQLLFIKKHTLRGDYGRSEAESEFMELFGKSYL